MVVAVAVVHHWQPWHLLILLLLLPLRVAACSHTEQNRTEPYQFVKE